MFIHLSVCGKNKKKFFIEIFIIVQFVWILFSYILRLYRKYVLTIRSNINNYSYYSAEYCTNSVVFLMVEKYSDAFEWVKCFYFWNGMNIKKNTLKLILEELNDNIYINKEILYTVSKI